MSRSSYSLPGLAGIGEAFQRLKWAGAFGCQEVEVRKALELVMEGPELPESSRTEHQTRGKGSELSLLQRGSRCHLIFMRRRSPVLSCGCARVPISHWKC